MTDIDFCTGGDCHKKDSCKRYKDYLDRVKHNHCVRYAKIGMDFSDCVQFQEILNEE